MKKPVLIGALIFSFLLAFGNNLLNRHSVAWVGGPEVLEKPTGWPSLTMMQGVHSGIKVALKGYHDHRMPILGGLLAFIVLAIWLKVFRKFPVGASVRSALRLGLAAMFLAAAWPKFQDPKGFAILVAQYQFLPSFLVNGFALWLSAFEVTVTVGLILTAWEKEFSALVGLLLVMFIVALGQALKRDLGIACGCFDIEGASDAGETWFSLVRDVVLLLPVAWLTFTGGARFIFSGKSK